MKKYISLVASIIMVAIISVITIISKQPKTHSKTKYTVHSKIESTNSASKVPDKAQEEEKEKKDTVDIYTSIVPDIGCTQIEYDTFNKINEFRVQNGLSKLEWSKELYKASTIRAKELPQKFSHTRPNGTLCFTVSNLILAENISAGRASGEKTANAWYNSPKHKENILSKNVKYGAISLYRTNSGYKYYWVNLFG